MSASLPDNGIVRALSDAVDADRDAMRDLLAALVAVAGDSGRSIIFHVAG